jgi:hypothetical protein
MGWGQSSRPAPVLRAAAREPRRTEQQEMEATPFAGGLARGISRNAYPMT